jgi:hypothetical protein
MLFLGEREVVALSLSGLGEREGESVALRESFREREREAVSISLGLDELSAERLNLGRCLSLTLI